MYSGICASDLHTMSEGWGQVDYPQCTCPDIAHASRQLTLLILRVVGHEIVGEVVRVGSKVTHVKVGDIVSL